MTVKHGWARKRRREPEPQHAEDAEPNASSAAAVAGPPAPPVTRRRSRAMKIITPLVLFGLGVVLLVIAVELYPSATDVPEPNVPTLTVYSHVPIYEFDISVIRGVSGRTRFNVVIDLEPNVKLLRSQSMSLSLLPVARNLGVQHPLTQTVHWGPSRSSQQVAPFIVNEADSGMSFNGTTASVAIPKLIYYGPGTPGLGIKYPIPSASSYDWSSFPATVVTRSDATWLTTTAKASVGMQTVATDQGQVVVGIDHARQTTDSDLTFAAGALLGLAGGAILSAVQEALHARD